MNRKCGEVCEKQRCREREGDGKKERMRYGEREREGDMKRQKE